MKQDGDDGEGLLRNLLSADVKLIHNWISIAIKRRRVDSRK